jgi:histidine triad (HIT) family protein
LTVPPRGAIFHAMSDCLFCKIRDGLIPAKQVYQDDRAVAFRDVNAQAPTHILVIPRKHIASLEVLTDEDTALVGHLHVVAAQLARAEGLSGGYRTLFNTGADAGQTVFHLHLHLLGGRPLGWPPG